MTMDKLKLQKIMNNRRRLERETQVCYHTQIETARAYVCVGNVSIPVGVR